MCKRVIECEYLSVCLCVSVYVTVSLDAFMRACVRAYVCASTQDGNNVFCTGDEFTLEFTSVCTNFLSYHIFMCARYAFECFVSYE